MAFSDFDCPVCKGIGDRVTGTVLRPTGIARHTTRCRRCRGTGVI
jgi:DnaJ-class molecular chaperone